ncbi:hypothetical protein EV385_6591 [Krasilnikovia cinnamomea]|uniref:Uncharacterized protein n=1 Tax=Krasilnikovia cinnamomea TaxID=349313 RepID=A0A4Q7Z7Q6_9ACTN|nr:hypothetical protein [Krasilnikovia cinnamomea]RZU46517.1 hypothetical protein EV385_6591 [Krasilnikovia cinnamomea]
MTISANLDKLLDKQYEQQDLHDLVNAPVHAIAGISTADAQALEKAFAIKTIGDLGRNEYIRAATAIAALADASK